MGMRMDLVAARKKEWALEVERQKEALAKFVTEVEMAKTKLANAEAHFFELLWVEQNIEN